MKPHLIKSRTIWLVFIFAALVSLSCQTVMQVFNEIGTEPAEALAEAVTPTVVERAETEEGSLSAALPTVEYLPQEEETHELSRQKQQQIFDALWDTVDAEYLYADFNGLNWTAAYDEYSAYITNGVSDQEFYFLMWEAIYRLGDDHSVFMDPAMVAQEEALYGGDFEYVGLGVVTVYVEDLGLMTIQIVFPNSPAERAGLAPHDNILMIDGQTMASLYDFDLGMVPSLHEVAGRDEAVFVVQTPGEEPRELTLPFESVNVQYPVPAEVLTTPDGQRIGYIVLTTFSDLAIIEGFPEQLSALGDVDGLIVDNRINTGGYNTVFEAVLQYFVAGEAGSFVSRSAARRLVIEPVEIHDSQSVPLVVLVGEGTVSYGEVFAGVLQDQGRAYLIGNTTFGNIETLWGFELPGDTFLWIAHETFMPAIDVDEDWEQTGIVPDLMVDAPWYLYTTVTDPAILAALDYFDK